MMDPHDNVISTLTTAIPNCFLLHFTSYSALISGLEYDYKADSLYFYTTDRD